MAKCLLGVKRQGETDDIRWDEATACGPFCSALFFVLDIFSGPDLWGNSRGFPKGVKRGPGISQLGQLGACRLMTSCGA